MIRKVQLIDHSDIPEDTKFEEYLDNRMTNNGEIIPVSWLDDFPVLVNWIESLPGYDPDIPVYIHVSW